MNGFDIRNPIAAEDETNVVDQGIVDYARIFKDQSNEELPTFDWAGAYNKTEWVHHDVITENKMNKIEDALYSINANVKESDVVMLNALDQVTRDANTYVKEHMAEVEQDVAEFERSLNADVKQFKTDTNAAIASHRNEVHGQLDSHRNEVHGQLTNFNATVTAHKNEVNTFISQFNTTRITKNGYYTLPGGLILQWGVFSVYFDGVALKVGTCNFNTPFKNEVFTIFIDTNAFGPDANGNAASFDMYSIAYNHQLNMFEYEIKTISGNRPMGTIYFSWFAIGK
jgi:hypothetical protein